MFKDKYQFFSEMVKKYNQIYYNDLYATGLQTPEEFIENVNKQYDLDFVLFGGAVRNNHLSEISAKDEEAGLDMRICFANDECQDKLAIGKVLFYSIWINKTLVNGNVYTVSK